MKRILLFTIALLGAAPLLLAQQRPHYTQYVVNPFIVNPAIAGIDNYMDLKMSVRDQWVGINGAPRSMYVTVQGPVGKNDYRTSSTSFQVPGENPRGKAYWENYTAAEPHHGVGFTLINDRTGSFNFSTAALTYAYHLGLSPTTNISAGFSAGISKVGIDVSKQDYSGNGDPSDPANGSVNTGQLTRVRPQMAAGLWLYSRDYFIGISAQNVLPSTINFVDDNASILTKGRMIPHMFLTAGYRFMLSDDINAIPSLMVKYIKGSSIREFQPEANMKLQYRDQLWLGGSYRYQDGFSGYLGLNVSNTFNVSYAYEKSGSNNILRDFNSGTHEIVFGFIIGNKYSQACPRCY